MSLGSFIRKQFIDILQWNEDRDGVLAWRHPMQDFEIQYGASLTVRESQMAVFVNEGKVADVFGPGMYKLTTQTLPILTYLKNWDKLFESPFKSDVIFFSTRLQLGRRWGTAQPVTLRDSEFGMVRLRFGVYVPDRRSRHVLPRNQRHARRVHGGRPGIAAAQHGGRRDDHGAGRLQGAVPGHGRQPGPDVAEHQRAAGADLRALRRQAGQLHRRERVAARRAAEGAGRGFPWAWPATWPSPSTRRPRPFRWRRRTKAASLASAPACRGRGAGPDHGAGAGRGGGRAGRPACAQAPAAVDPVQKLQQLKDLLDKGLITAADYDAAKADVLKKLTS